MRFRPSVKPRLGTRRDQRRVVMLFGMLVLVILSMSKTSNPRNWEWLTGAPKQKKAITSEEEILIAKQQEQIKEQLLTGVRPTKVNVGTEPPASQKSKTETDSNVPGPAKSPDGDSPAVPVGNPKILASPPDYVIAKRVFSEINEQVFHIRHSEAPAYWGVLATIRDLPQAEAEQAALKDITYSQVFSEPDSYRGQLITIEGELLRLTSTPASKNDFGIETVYEGWLRNADSGKNPYVFHCLEKPAELPEGEKLSERIRITGYFFKRYLYAAKSGTPYAAPLLLARRIRWYPVVQRQAADPNWAPYILICLVVIGSTLAGTICWFILREQRRSNAQLKRFVAPTISDFGPIEAESSIAPDEIKPV
ncbi:MAG: hypothetical protein JWM11_2432 [Planctomycetaceae bacterium]|nr:hypothetical protein [Planctomycetaceae bacterium]